MISSIIAALVKPVTSFMFGTPLSSKITMSVLAILAFGGSIWYWTDLNAQKDLENVRLTEANKRFEENEKTLQAAIEAQSEAFLKREKEFELAIIKQRKLQGELIALSKEKEEADEIFNRKEKSFQDMLNRRGKTIVRLSNLGTERVYNKWREETTKIDKSLYQGESRLLTSTKDDPVKTGTN